MTGATSALPGVDYGRKWWVLTAVGIGVILATIDGSIVNIALPTIRTRLDATLPVVQWVSVGYLLTLAALTLGVGRWGDIVGKKRIYTAGFVAFTTASVMCGLAPSIEVLIGFRVLQALGATMILALGTAIVTEAFPPTERGKALGYIGTFVSIGIVVGPVVGGLLISVFDWRSIFFVNLPVGIVGTVMAARFVPDTPPVGGQRFDYPGAVLLSLGLLAISASVTSGQGAGFDSVLVLAGLAGGVALLAVFAVVELRVDSPMLDLRLFRNPLLSVSVVSGFLVFICVSAVFFLLPFYLEGVLGFSTRTTGLALGVAPLVLGVVSPLAGTWSDRIGIRRITLAGLTILFVAFLAFRTLSTTTSLVAYTLLAVPVGAGIGMFQSPNNSAIMGSMPRRYVGVGGGVLTLTRLLGQISGVAVLGSLWAVRVAARAGSAQSGDAVSAPAEYQVAGLHDTATVMGVLMALAIVIGWYGMRRETVEGRRETPPDVDQDTALAS